MSQDSLAPIAPEELISLARARAPFYQRLYAGLPDPAKLIDVPVIDPLAYWEAHGQDRQEVLTAIQQDGFVLNSSGTSGTPKFSYATAPEWNAATTLSARSFDAAGLQDGDRVATLFATGNLYASLLFATESFRRVRAKVIQFPVGYSTDFEAVAKVIESFKINVLAGFPTHLLRVIDALAPGTQIERIVYAGELFTPDQQGSLRKRFPGLKIHSAGYASVEAGPVGYADASCTASEHRVFDGGTVIEILDEETSELIAETGRPGQIVFTNLVRRLMPLIRYPTGDRAQWVEPAGSADRKFLLLGRAGQAVRIARYNLDLAEVAGWIKPLRERFGVEQFQLLVTRENLLDRLTFRMVSVMAPDVLEEGSVAVLRIFRAERVDIHKGIDAGILNQPQVEWIRHDQLIVSPRSGKMLAVVDRRDG